MYNSLVLLYVYLTEVLLNYSDVFYSDKIMQYNFI